MLTVDQLVKTYATSPGRTGGGVHDATFNIKAAEFFTLLGPSGCGKTTALRSVAGLELPNSGAITIGGSQVFDSTNGVNVPANQRGIGMVFQSYAVWPHMTVSENIAFPLEMSRNRHSKQAIATLVIKVLTTVGLEAYASRSAHQLSGGQQQRLSLARALVSEPKLLLLDEPLSNLDAQLRDQMRTELRRLQKDVGVATLYVTHDQSEALALSDRIAVMRDGVIEQIGTPQQIYSTPRNRFVATFIGRTNIFEGQSAAAGGGTKGMLAETEIGKIAAQSEASLLPAGPFAVSIRPEYVRLSCAAEGGNDNSLNHFVGRISDSSFYGDATEYEVRLSTGHIVNARMSPAGNFAPSSDVVVCFPPEHVICLNGD